MREGRSRVGQKASHTTHVRAHEFYSEGLPLQINEEHHLPVLTNRILLLLVLWLSSLTITLLVIIVRRPAETTIIEQRAATVVVSRARELPYATSISTPLSLAEKSPPVRKATTELSPARKPATAPPPVRQARTEPPPARNPRSSIFPDVAALIEQARREVEAGGDDPPYTTPSSDRASDLIREHTAALSVDRQLLVTGCMRGIDFSLGHARIAKLVRCAEKLEDAAR